MAETDADSTPDPIFRGIFGEGRVAWRATVYALLAWSLPGLVLLFRYYSELEYIQTLEELRSRHVVELQADLVARSLDRMCVDVRFLAEQDDLQDLLRGQGDVARVAQEYATFLQAMGDYDRLSLLTGAGLELVRVEDRGGSVHVAGPGELQDRASSAGFRVAGSLKDGEVRFTPLLDDESGSVLQVATAVADSRSSRRFVLMLGRRGADLRSGLTALAKQHPGRTLLQDGGGTVLHQTERGLTRPAPVAGRDARSKETDSDAWARIEREDHGQFLSGEGLYTFDTVRPERAEGGMLKVVSRVSTEEIRATVTAAYGRHVWAALAAVFLIFVLSYHVAQGQVLRAEHRKRLADSERRMRALSTELLLAQERERGRVARDLHDEVGQIGTAVHLQLQRAAGAQSPEKKNELIARADEAVQGLMHWAQATASRLRPAALDDLGLKEAILLLVTQFEEAAGVRVGVELETGEQPLPPLASEQAYRIVQESLTNVAKQARATQVELRVERTGEELLLEITDNGVGFDSEREPGNGFGLQGMRERVDLLGGRFELRSAPGQSTVVRVILPLDALDAEDEHARSR